MTPKNSHISQLSYSTIPSLSNFTISQFLDGQIRSPFLQFKYPEFVKFLQFLDKKNKGWQFLNPNIAQFLHNLDDFVYCLILVRYLDPEIIKMVDKFYIKKGFIVLRACWVPKGACKYYISRYSQILDPSPLNYIKLA